MRNASTRIIFLALTPFAQSPAREVFPRFFLRAKSSLHKPLCSRQSLCHGHALRREHGGMQGGKSLQRTLLG